jgi:hypothetical protein
MWLHYVAVILQVFLAALTTALSAGLNGKNTSVISALAGSSTVVTAFLTRSHAVREPAKSRDRATDLNQFLREIEGFLSDHGYETGDKLDDKIDSYRLGLEKLLRNTPGTLPILPIRPEGEGPKSGAGNPDDAKNLGQGFNGTFNEAG